MTQPDRIHVRPVLQSTAAAAAGVPIVVHPDRAPDALATRPDPQANKALQALLHKRLRFLSLLCTSLYAVGALARVIRNINDPGGALRSATPVDLLFWAVCFLLATCLGVLWSSPRLSLGRLRLLELVLFGNLVLSLFLENVYTIWFTNSWASTRSLDPTRIPFSTLWLTFCCWFLVVTYGVLIPNTSRRCATIVIGVASAALVLWINFGLTKEVVRDQNRGQFLSWLVFLTSVVTSGVALAIYSCHRIETLQREVATARRLGQYALGKLLGSGGMGEVYLAEHVLLKRLCAVKLIRAERVGDRDTLRRFALEVETTAKLTHPNTVQVYDYGHATDGTFYYVMEYLPGLTLDEIVSRAGPLPPARVIHLLRQVCGALREAHGIPLIHRDIKPSNVMVCERGGLHDTVKLLDFGVVLPNRGGPNDQRLTHEGAIVGTPAYMSPEQAGGQNDVDARGDIYSVGALAYFLLSGRPPFAGRSPMQILAAHIYEAPELLAEHCPEVPADLETVVMRCLAKQPGERFQNVERVDEALARCTCAGQWSTQEAADWWRAQTLPSTSSS